MKNCLLLFTTPPPGISFSSIGTPGVDVAGLVAGLVAALVSAIMFVVVAMYCFKYRNKGRSRSRYGPGRKENVLSVFGGGGGLPLCVGCVCLPSGH